MKVIECKKCGSHDVLQSYNAQITSNLFYSGECLDLDSTIYEKGYRTKWRCGECGAIYHDQQQCDDIAKSM